MKNKIKDHFNGNYLSFYEKYLESPKKIGDEEYAAICPFHNDTNPSLNFNNQTGKYFCHGCQERGDIFNFHSKLNGLNTKTNFKKVLEGIASDFGISGVQEKKRVVKQYVYTDLNGKPLHRTVRTEPKGFYQERYATGKWIAGLKGIDPVLYQLPAIAKANEVLIVEGEKDADNLTKLGFTATTCPMGVKKWKDQYSQHLEDKKVILIPDNDKEGKEHMARIGVSLNGKTANLKLIEIPGLPNKGDVSDFIESFKSREEAGEKLSILIENAEPYKPPKTYTHEDAILEVNEFRKLNLPVKEKLLDPWLTLNMIALIVGWRGVGKTWFAMGLLDAVTRGIAFGPWETIKSVPCLYHEAEMAAQDVQTRLNSLNPDSERLSPLYVYSDAYANLLGLGRSNLLDETWRNTVKQILIDKDIKLWVLDNLASTTPGVDENIKKDWDPINKWLLELRFHGISTILLHHTNKAGQQRGTSAREDNIDISIMLKQPHNYLPEEGARFLVKFEKSRVPTADLPQIADTQFHLSQDERGHLVWTFGNFKKETSKEVLIQLDEGMKQKEVADLLGISNGRVSQIRKWGIKNDYLTEKNKLTQAGVMSVN